MKKFEFPVYIYFNNDDQSNETQFPARYSVIASSLLYEKYTETPGTGILIETLTLQHSVNPAKNADAYLGDNVFLNYAPVYTAGNTSQVSPVDPQYYADATKLLGMTNAQRSVLILPDDTSNPGIDKMLLVNNEAAAGPLSNGSVSQNDVSGYAFSASLNGEISYDITSVDNVDRIAISVNVYPDDIMVNGALNPFYIQQYLNNEYKSLRLYIVADMDSNGQFNDIYIYKTCNHGGISIPLLNSFKDVSFTNALVDEIDMDNPYADIPESKPGGGDGELNPNSIDSIQGTPVPGLPTISVNDLGFITMYNPTGSQIKQLADYMWSPAFDLNTFKKLFSDPMDAIIGLAIVPVGPSVGGSKNVTFGTIDSGIAMNYLSSNWVQLDCGWVSVTKYIGCFLDSDPYTDIQIYLPFIGIKKLSADDINGGSIHVVYNIDVLTGACACFIEHDTRGVLYTYNGSCITNVPLTAANFSGAIQNAVSAVISGIGTAAGIATGSAPITAMGIAGLLNNAANTAMNSKPQIQRSGNLGGSAGILSVLTPYVIIQRPNLSVPANIGRYIGQTSNMTCNLNAIKGFTMVQYIHIENCTGTSEEIAEIESLLQQGVYL